ncbi:hypothetical protein E2562_002011 [Oryza meyeriana var. granulata]|uniref:Uncharacterized protein n=1 Tax=Oryza meyeriana var. granulata TaxID=110450 RepID=A0A6G1C590_9ORYZ|nr:hypothetical protein E2562_002011 [Oryza meyeriana var. granulata]
MEGRWQANQESDTIESGIHVSSQDGLFAEDRAATEKTLEVHIVILSTPQLGSARIVCKEFLPATALFYHAAVAAPALCRCHYVATLALCNHAVVATATLYSPAAIAVSPHVHSAATPPSPHLHSAATPPSQHLHSTAAPPSPPLHSTAVPPLPPLLLHSVATSPSLPLQRGSKIIGMQKEHNNEANMHASINLDMERLLKNIGILKSTNHDQTTNAIGGRIQSGDSLRKIWRRAANRRWGGGPPPHRGCGTNVAARILQ